MNLLVGIPAYNEEKMIAFVIKSIPKKIKGIKNIDILVLDDGSSDKTATEAEKHGATVLAHILNRGLGGALKTILAYARGNNYEILVTFDADGQHNSLDISRLIDPIQKGKCDMVIGTRWKDQLQTPLSRLLINKLANIFTYLLYGVATSDSQSGMRALGKRAIDSISLQTDGMEVSSEFFKEITRNKLRFMEIPIKAVYTDYSRAKGQKIANAPKVFWQLLLRLLR